MSKILMFFFCFLAIGSHGCLPNMSSAKKAAIDSQRVDDEAQSCDVYAVVLSELYAKEGDGQIILSNETSLDGLNDKDLQEQLGHLYKFGIKDIPEEAIKDFINKNRQPLILHDCFNLQNKLRLLDQEEVQTISRSPHGWNDFLQKYPRQSLITLSRIGFNRSLDQAFLYSGRQSSLKSGRGGFTLLIKENNQWVIKNRIPSWVS